MTLDELITKLYEVYEDNDCDGNIPVHISTYSCGTKSQRPLDDQEIVTETSETGEISVVILAEDN